MLFLVRPARAVNKGKPLSHILSSFLLVRYQFTSQPGRAQLLPRYAKLTELSQATGRKADTMHSFPTRLSLESGDTVRIIIFCFPVLQFLGKKSFAVGLTFARVPEDGTEAFMVRSSAPQPGPYTRRLTKALLQQLYGFSFTQATCKYTRRSCICPGPGLVKDLARSGFSSAVPLGKYSELS